MSSPGEWEPAKARQDGVDPNGSGARPDPNLLQTYVIRLYITKQAVAFGCRALNLESVIGVGNAIFAFSGGRVGGFDVLTEDRSTVLASVHPMPIIAAVGQAINEASKSLIVPAVQVNDKLWDRLKKGNGQ